MPAASVSTNIVQDAGHCGARYLLQGVCSGGTDHSLDAWGRDNKRTIHHWGFVGGIGRMVWELPEWGRVVSPEPWAQDRQMKQFLDLTGVRIPRVEVTTGV